MRIITVYAGCLKVGSKGGESEGGIYLHSAHRIDTIAALTLSHTTD